MKNCIFFLIALIVCSIPAVKAIRGSNISYTKYATEGCSKEEDEVIETIGYVDGACTANSLGEYSIFTVLDAQKASLW